MELEQLEQNDSLDLCTGEKIFGQWLTRKFKKILPEESLLKLKTIPDQIQAELQGQEKRSSRSIVDKISKMAPYEPASPPPLCFNEITKELNNYLKGGSGLTGGENMFPVLQKVVRAIGYSSFKGFRDGQKLFLEIAGRKIQEAYYISYGLESLARDIVRNFNGSIAFWLFWNIKLGLSKVAEECSSSLGLSEIKKQYSERLKKLDSLLNSKKVLIVNGETHKRAIYNPKSSPHDKKVARRCHQLYRYSLESARVQQLTSFVEGLIAEVPVFDYANPKRPLPNICGLEEEVTYAVGSGYLDSCTPPKTSDGKIDYSGSWKTKTWLKRGTSTCLLPPGAKRDREIETTGSKSLILNKRRIGTISSTTKNPYALKSLRTFLDIFDFKPTERWDGDQTLRNKRMERTLRQDRTLVEHDRARTQIVISNRNCCWRDNMKAKMTGPFHSGQHTFAAQVGSRHIPSSIAGPHSLETLLDNYDFGEEITVILLPKESDSFSKFGLSRLQVLGLRIDGKEKTKKIAKAYLGSAKRLAKIPESRASDSVIDQLSCIITGYYKIDMPGSALNSVVRSLLRI
ncbi:MAG: hypothetical protein GY710_14155 [Desulfobacteraceae bacterium]|nr:hypothetical protein [Desulfobacteraceae bacterium]